MDWGKAGLTKNIAHKATNKKTDILNFRIFVLEYLFFFKLSSEKKDFLRSF